MEARLRQRMASLVAMVLAISFLSGCAGIKPHARHRRSDSEFVPIALDGGQPESRHKKAMRVKVLSIVEGEVGTVILKSPDTVTVTLMGYKTTVVFQGDDTNLTLDVPGSPASGNFAHGTYAGHTLFEGVQTVSLTANVPETVYYKIQSISDATQFSFFALDEDGTHGGAYNVVATPAP